MEKIAIVGPSGAGKTTLAQKLSPSFKIKAFHLDRFFWQHDWDRIERETRIDTLQNLVQRQQWIIEGSYINSSKIHLNAADTIIFLDIFPLKCLWRIIKRHFIYKGRFRRDIPEGCTDKLSLPLILKVLFFSFQDRIKLEMNLHTYSPGKVIRLHSTKEVEDFLENPELYVQKYRQSVKQPSVLGEAFIINFGYFSYAGYSHTKVSDISQQN